MCFGSPLHPIGITSFKVVLIKRRCLNPVNMDTLIELLLMYSLFSELGWLKATLAALNLFK